MFLHKPRLTQEHKLSVSIKRRKGAVIRKMEKARVRPEHIKSIKKILEALDDLSDPRDQGAILTSAILAWIELCNLPQNMTRPMLSLAIATYKMPWEEAVKCRDGIGT